MRILITGADGFVGRHLTKFLAERGDEVTRAGRIAREVDFAFDLHDSDGIERVVAASRPDVIFHLAAQSFVPASLADPIDTYLVNVVGTARLFEAIRRVTSSARPPLVVLVSSAEVYGRNALQTLPLRETDATAPVNPYAASKAGAESVALASSASFGIPVIVTRAFNHVGPGQDERFVLPSFAAQLARIAGGAPPRLDVGNLESARDILDVRDVVAAYAALAERGRPGEIYNVCSGTPVKMKEMLRMLIAHARVAVEVREDPARMRPADVPVIYGDNTKLREATGWSARISLAQSIRDVYDAAREQVASAT